MMGAIPGKPPEEIEEMAASFKAAGVKAPPCCLDCWGAYQDGPAGWHRTEPCGYCAAAYVGLLGIYAPLGISFWKALRIKEGLMG